MSSQTTITARRHWSFIVFWSVFAILAILPVAVHGGDANPMAGAAGGFMAFVILVLGAILWSCFGSPTPQVDPRLCNQCGTVSPPKFYDAGSGLIAFFLFMLFLIPGIFYHFWRRSKQFWGCPACHSANIIPVNSPAAIAHFQGTKQITS